MDFVANINGSYMTNHNNDDYDEGYDYDDCNDFDNDNFDCADYNGINDSNQLSNDIDMNAAEEIEKKFENDLIEVIYKIANIHISDNRISEFCIICNKTITDHDMYSHWIQCHRIGC
jgi:hypothetical protein